MASEDLNELFRAARSFAEIMLAKEGEFIPFGVSMEIDGKVALVGGDVGSEHPASVDVIELLQSTFRKLALDGEIRAAGVCMDVRVVPPGQSDKSDAIGTRLAHISGESTVVFVPYTRLADGDYGFGGIFAISSSSFSLVQGN